MGSPARRQAATRARPWARHAARHEHWTHALAAQPWITLVLLGALVIGLLGLLGRDQYAADAVLTTPTARAASEAAVRLSGPGVVGEVEEAVELAPALRGDVTLDVAADHEPLEVVLRATASDPRLAALAADTALALLVEDAPDVGYEIGTPATVPTDPVRPRTLRWAWVALVALAVAVWVERNHRTWLRDHPDEVEGGAR